MIRNVTRILILLACCVLASSMDRIARAQSGKPDSDSWYGRCANWTPAPWDKPGTRRLLFPFAFTGEYPGRYQMNRSRVAGSFVVSGSVIMSLISEPNGTEPTPQFVTRAGTTIDFFPEMSRAPIKVRSGRFADYGAPPFNPYAIECVRGESKEILEQGRDLGKSLTDRIGGPKPSEPEPKLADIFKGKTAGSADVTRADAPSLKGGDEARGAVKDKPAEAPSGLREVFNPTSPSAATPTRPDAPAAPAESSPRARSDGIALALKNFETPRDAAAPQPVCEVPRLTPLPVANGMVPASLQEVGLRNARIEARGFDYPGAGSDVRPLDSNLDIADSARKLIRYEAIGARRNGAELLWVSLAGTDESRLRRARGPAKTLTLIVVAGAAELAMSGLDLIGNELRKPGAAPVNLDIEWHAVDETGAIRLAGKYSSLDALVGDAAAKSRAMPDLLGERQLLTLFDGFESLLKSRTATVDKVFWIKGAYPIPSSIPQRFEKFLSAVSESSAVPHTPAGRPGKWLQIITARMAGFSIAYLKEPVNSQGVGDVFEEAPGAVSGPRRLIGIEDAGVLASNLRAALILSSALAKPGAETPPERETLTGRLVLDAKEVFDQRGYLLSAEAAESLRLHLARVASLWDGPIVRPEVLASLAEASGKPSPTIADVLQMGPHYPQLPKLLPDWWFTKPVKYLNAAESNAARSAVAAYAEGASMLVEAIRMAASGARANCGLFYVAEAYFGLDKFQRPPPGRRAGAPKTR
jgi:hypothetical protein